VAKFGKAEMIYGRFGYVGSKNNLFNPARATNTAILTRTPK
jgi:hypothetical protein